MYTNNIDNKLLEDVDAKLKGDGIQKVVAGAVIFFRDGKILLLERIPEEFKGGLVELPSGGVDLGESIIDGLVREVKEETGLEVTEINRYIGSFDYQSSSGKKTRQLNFAISVQSENVRISPLEHSQFHIVDPNGEDFQALKISEETKRVIHKSLEG
jgi:8-oxo-dGTP diphosphatase